MTSNRTFVPDDTQESHPRVGARAVQILLTLVAILVVALYGQVMCELGRMAAQVGLEPQLSAMTRGIVETQHRLGIQAWLMQRLAAREGSEADGLIEALGRPTVMTWRDLDASCQGRRREGLQVVQGR
jgi:hypothetical protein